MPGAYIPDLTLDSRARFLKALVSGGLLAGVALSPKLWIASRTYPLVPVAASFPRFRHPLDWMLVAGLAGAVATVALVARPLPALAAALCLGTLLVCLDQSRLQPWFYQYLLMLGSLAWFYATPDPRRRAGAVNACRLLLASIYFWSGVQKINSNFASAILPSLAHSAIEAFPRVLPVLTEWGRTIPFLEAGIGVALLLPRLRTPAIAAAAVMHAALLLALGPLGSHANSVVWPWNLVMAAAVIALFARTRDVPARAILLPAGPPVCRAAAIFVALVPAMSLAGLWDNYPGWALYSGNKDEVKYYVTDALFDRLPAAVQDYVYEYRPDLSELDLYDWSWSELNVPVYPELRIYLQIERALCGYASAPGDLKMTVRRKALWLGSRRANVEADCSALVRSGP